MSNKSSPANSKSWSTQIIARCKHKCVRNRGKIFIFVILVVVVSKNRNEALHCHLNKSSHLFRTDRVQRVLNDHHHLVHNYSEVFQKIYNIPRSIKYRVSFNIFSYLSKGSHSHKPSSAQQSKRTRASSPQTTEVHNNSLGISKKSNSNKVF